MFPLNTENGNMSNPVIVQKEIAEERYQICKGCPRLTNLRLCSICNCIMPVKVKFARVSCPAGKWKAVDDTTKHTSVAYEDII